MTRQQLSQRLRKIIEKQTDYFMRYEIYPFNYGNWTTDGSAWEFKGDLKILGIVVSEPQPIHIDNE